jgi:hypothetical protein
VKHAKIVLVAQWDGWCGACAADRPLALTRTGRQHLRTWLTGAADDSRPLTLTCRLCGTGVVVPLERDDPPVVATVVEEPAPEPAAVTLTEPGTPDVVLPDVELPTAPVAPADAEYEAARQRVGPPPVLVAPVEPPRVERATPVAAPVLPLQRTPSSGGLAELQLLADGIDLLSTPRS